jgi:hypothetical protein
MVADSARFGGERVEILRLAPLKPTAKTKPMKVAPRMGFAPSGAGNIHWPPPGE